MHFVKSVKIKVKADEGRIRKQKRVWDRESR